MSRQAYYVCESAYGKRFTNLNNSKTKTKREKNVRFGKKDREIARSQQMPELKTFPQLCREKISCGGNNGS